MSRLLDLRNLVDKLYRQQSWVARSVDFKTSRTVGVSTEWFGNFAEKSTIINSDLRSA